ncbi:NADP-dependent 3-hydroxy acid dehydrogenase YdfG [Streptomyces sp. 846.5]|nr:SDR family NAD(P)-dependent oxidoreductase [Streptomyces sp. 846.5]TDT97260.1 NADP-dependent 3-hydroxy acid dehydrogenase YdfG [Streptomyces sp. 846.5]
MTSKTWFITGAGRGFGRHFTEAALERGDRVAATARNLSTLDDLAATHGDRLFAIALDVTDTEAVRTAVVAANERFGALDIIVNNAGYGLFGMVEELSAEELRQQFEVNFFGAFHVTQAALPLLRAQGSGHIVQISTIGGVLAFPGLGGYNASKWALEGLTEALAQEVGEFGIKVTLIEPGQYGTDWAGSSAVNATPNAAYDDIRRALDASGESRPAEWLGKPEAVGKALLEIVDSPTPPLRAFFGTAPTVVVPQAYAARLAEWDSWKEFSVRANG